jgi:hypothetical protein
MARLVYPEILLIRTIYIVYTWFWNIYRMLRYILIFFLLFGITGY